MAQSITVTGSTAATGSTSGTMALNPVCKSTTVILSAVTASTTAGTVNVDYSLDDPTIPGGPAVTWALLSSAASITSSQIEITPLAWTILSPIAGLRIRSTQGSTGAGPSVYTLKALQSITA